jgi:hypothetical protein
VVKIYPIPSAWSMTVNTPCDLAALSNHLIESNVEIQLAIALLGEK